MTVPDIRWRKASWSSGQETCVLVAHTLAAVQDSKNPDGAPLTVDAGALLLAAKSGRLDR